MFYYPPSAIMKKKEIIYFSQLRHQIGLFSQVKVREKIDILNIFYKSGKKYPFLL